MGAKELELSPLGELQSLDRLIKKVDAGLPVDGLIDELFAGV